ncbi:Asp23/Gls24 family envelope stress response protein [Rhodococcus antarcticus]|uniref:Asp23/Gls24 family envelope stress response protein n=1 Tax=Rhodococcus antarcticus TaxID=2987751 RepID=A0ABY6P337_9NOCA|nr:Asp23/Gls24 family envelope stress response protein [Rhodococcus antarcticus]UZJ26057.1 Asp23/Gls24 family envelope stress response protein [Rhodococcus antarcticus]
MAELTDTADALARREPGQRGSLVVKDKVIDRIAVVAATSIPGVQRHTSGLDRVTGRGLPRTDVTVAGGHIRARIDIAVTWPQSLPTVAAAVRDAVTERLTTLVGFTVDAIDVGITTIVPAEQPHQGRRVQ